MENDKVVGPGIVMIGDHTVPKVTRFKYLGSTIPDDGEMDGDVNHRIKAGWMKWQIKMMGKVSYLIEKCQSGLRGSFTTQL
ncbi:hypothetical protein Lal_00043278 [Lupinus albus]|nr:hypothetical protein Lal_00043278 [Lupinus albus]